MMTPVHSPLFPCVAQVRLRCQKGIPLALRGRAWLYLSGGKVKKEQNKGKFQVSEASLSLPPRNVLHDVFQVITFIALYFRNWIHLTGVT